MMGKFTECFMSLWRSLIPVICSIHGFAVAGGSDIALCCDLIVMEEDAKIGYPPARVWGIPTTNMWLLRGGPELARRMLFCGDLITGKEAQKLGLISFAVSKSQLEQTVEKLAERISSIPKNQLMMSKLLINKSLESNLAFGMGQMISTVFDGFARHSQEGITFETIAKEKGWKEAVRVRDSGIPIPNKFKSKL